MSRQICSTEVTCVYVSTSTHASGRRFTVILALLGVHTIDMTRLGLDALNILICLHALEMLQDTP